MRVWLGLATFAAGAGLLAQGYLHKRRVMRLGVGPGARRGGESRMSMAGEIARPFILAMLGYVGLKATLLYVAFDRGSVLSPFDLAGFLFLLASYGAWLVLKTKYRPAAAVASPEAGPQPIAQAAEPEVRRAA